MAQNIPGNDSTVISGMGLQSSFGQSIRCGFCMAAKQWMRSLHRDGPNLTSRKTPDRLTRDQVRKHLKPCVREKTFALLRPLNGTVRNFPRMVYEEAGPFLRECADVLRQFALWTNNGSRIWFDTIRNYNITFKHEFTIAMADWIPILPLHDIMCEYAEFKQVWPSGGIFLPPSELDPSARVRVMTPEQEAKKWGVNFQDLFSFLMDPEIGVLNSLAEFDLFLDTGNINIIQPPSNEMDAIESTWLSVRGQTPVRVAVIEWKSDSHLAVRGEKRKASGSLDDREEGKGKAHKSENATSKWDRLTALEAAAIISGDWREAAKAFDEMNAEPIRHVSAARAKAGILSLSAENATVTLSPSCRISRDKIEIIVRWLQANALVWTPKNMCGDEKNFERMRLEKNATVHSIANLVSKKHVTAVLSAIQLADGLDAVHRALLLQSRHEWTGVCLRRDLVGVGSAQAAASASAASSSHPNLVAESDMSATSSASSKVKKS
jgi:hypothetical protein